MNIATFTGWCWKTLRLALLAGLCLGAVSPPAEMLSAADERAIRPFQPDSQIPGEPDPPNLLISRWTMPVSGLDPLNLVLDVSGNAWFTAASSNIQDFVLGELDPATGNITIWKSLVGIRRIHYLDRDSAGNIWYLTTYADAAGNVPDVLGKYDPAANTFTEYTNEAMVGLFGLQVDREAGEIWFLGSSPTPSIYRFQISGSVMTAWPIPSFGSIHDLGIDQQGYIWAVDIPWLDGISANSSLLRLVPSTKTLTQFPLQNQSQAPFQLAAANSGEIWLSEYPADVNGLARLDITSNAYEQFDLSVAGSYPGGIAIQGNVVWSNLSGNASLARLQTPAAFDHTTTLIPADISLNPVTVKLTEAVYEAEAGNFAQVTYSAPQTPPQVIYPSSDGSFALYDIPGADPACGDLSNPWAFTIAEGRGGLENWFTGCGFIGRALELQKPLFLPVVKR